MTSDISEMSASELVAKFNEARKIYAENQVAELNKMVQAVDAYLYDADSNYEVTVKALNNARDNLIHEIMESAR